MGVKKYSIDYDWKAEVEIEINDELCTEDQLNEINTFWSGSEDRLADAGGVLLNAVLVLLAKTALHIQLDHDYNLRGVVDAFNWDAKFGECGIEGWPKMDGTSGIKITGISEFRFESSDFAVHEK